jgi:hypothetical protein
MQAAESQVLQILSTRVVLPGELPGIESVPDAEFITLPPPEFYGGAVRELLADGAAQASWSQADPPSLEREGFIVIQGGGGMFESEQRYVIERLADVLAERGPFPTEAFMRGEAIDPKLLLPIAEAIFSTVSIPISQSPIRGSSLADLMALAGGIDFQTVHLTHLGGREIVLALLTAAGCKIVFGAADGIAYALKNGFSYYLLRWAGVPERVALDHARKEVRRTRAKGQAAGGSSSGA